MMNFLHSMQQRYTTKKYNPELAINQDRIQALKEILRLTPSSINSQPWRFSFVSDQGLKKSLSQHSKINTQKVLDCDTLVVFSRVDSLEVFEAQLKRELPEKAYDYYKGKVKSMPEEEIKNWFDKQVYIALGVFLSACAVMKIDATPMEGLEPEAYDRILEQQDHTTIVAVSIGYRAKDDQNQPSITPKTRMDLDQVIVNR
ncbi:MAG: nitroreductase family protein [Dokdonia sp.]